MNNVEILPLIIDLSGSFFKSSRDALERARQAQLDKKPQEPTGLNLFPYEAEPQASIESIAFSFLTIEATINYLFFNELRERQLKGIEKQGVGVKSLFLTLALEFGRNPVKEGPRVRSQQSTKLCKQLRPDHLTRKPHYQIQTLSMRENDHFLFLIQQKKRFLKK